MPGGRSAHRRVDQVHIGVGQRVRVLAARRHPGARALVAVARQRGVVELDVAAPRLREVGNFVAVDADQVGEVGIPVGIGPPCRTRAGRGRNAAPAARRSSPWAAPSATARRETGSRRRRSGVCAPACARRRARRPRPRLPRPRSPTPTGTPAPPSSRSANPSSASITPADHERRRNSPSVTAGMPISSWKATMPRIAASSAARNPAASSLPARRALTASSSSGGRTKLPTCSARNGGAVIAGLRVAAGLTL